MYAVHEALLQGILEEKIWAAACDETVCIGHTGGADASPAFVATKAMKKETPPGQQNNILSY
jgi:hypothetical protein